MVPILTTPPGSRALYLGTHLPSFGRQQGIRSTKHFQGLRERKPSPSFTQGSKTFPAKETTSFHLFILSEIFFPTGFFNPFFTTEQRFPLFPTQGSQQAKNHGQSPWARHENFLLCTPLTLNAATALSFPSLSAHFKLFWACHHKGHGPTSYWPSAATQQRSATLRFNHSPQPLRHNLILQSLLHSTDLLLPRASTLF